MDILLKQIFALQTANQEIIERIESVHESISYDYWIELDEKRVVKLGKERRKLSVSAILDEITITPEFDNTVWDVFNDRPNWDAQSWSELKELNLLIPSIVAKFEMFDKSNKKALAALRKYLSNLEEIQECLGPIEEMTFSRQSRTSELEERVSSINQNISLLIQSGVARYPKKAFDGSTVLSPQHKTKLVEWYGSGWKLLFKASKHGWTAKKFHKKCNGKGSTIVIVSHTYNTYLIGGFAGASWGNQTGFINNNDCSLFTLSNPANFPPTKFACINPMSAMYNSPEHGPTFGSGNDLSVFPRGGSSYAAFPTSYQDTTGRGRALFDNGMLWNPQEVEVFYLPSN
eukprot:TRINITY_DN1292_c0_g2_i11.p1 TRINITY_DN1292_c0_g2~~TRINITY_DN1292_c0_g2_i11.p1  ORF type:complete len:345 (+),score=55.99 TRINITY_DN1292_c0_g2_i11:718-1752(+)